MSATANPTLALRPYLQEDAPLLRRINKTTYDLLLQYPAVADVKQAQAKLGVAQANLQVQKAVVSRLEELTSFERVTAPFSGVVTAKGFQDNGGPFVPEGGTDADAFTEGSQVGVFLTTP